MPHDVKKLDTTGRPAKRLTSRADVFDHADETRARDGALVHGVCRRSEGLSRRRAESDFDSAFRLSP